MVWSPLQPSRRIIWAFDRKTPMSNREQLMAVSCFRTAIRVIQALIVASFARANGADKLLIRFWLSVSRLASCRWRLRRVPCLDSWALCSVRTKE